MQRIVFRADASPSIGGGHVMRCLALAEALRRDGAECWFASSAESLKTVPALRKSGHHYIELQHSGDAIELCHAMPEGCDWLVVDHYGWSAVQETPCRPWARNILVIDDLADRSHDCDVLLDQTYGRAEVEYEHLLPSNSKLLVGTRYALLRPEFSEWRTASLAKRQSSVLRRVMVSMGLSDPANFTMTILEGILESGLALTVDVVLGRAAPGLSAVRKMVASHAERFTLLVDTEAMAELLSECDFCFGAAGSSAWERCCLGLPTAMVTLAANQNKIAAELAKAEAAIFLGHFEDVSSVKIAGLLRDLYAAEDKMAQMSVRAAEICDGRGTERISRMLNCKLQLRISCR